jgi:predicted Fe-Mo cluster-binding NifX family protein
MKILVATTKGGLDDTVSPVFGRCATFTIIHVTEKRIEDTKIVPNRYAGGTGGVGIQVAQLAVNEKVNVVIAGTFGPNAANVLAQAGIEMVPVSGIAVKDAVMGYLNKELAASTGVPGVTGFGPGMGWGRGRGRGRARGRGGGGGGRGMGRYYSQPPFMPPIQPQVLAPTHSNCMNFAPPNRCSLKDVEIDPQGEACEDFQSRTSAPFFPAPHGFVAPRTTKGQEIEWLKSEKEALEARLKEIRERIDVLKT